METPQYKTPLTKTVCSKLNFTLDRFRGFSGNEIPNMRKHRGMPRIIQQTPSVSAIKKGKTSWVMVRTILPQVPRLRSTKTARIALIGGPQANPGCGCVVANPRQIPLTDGPTGSDSRNTGFHATDNDPSNGKTPTSTKCRFTGATGNSERTLCHPVHLQRLA